MVKREKYKVHAIKYNEKMKTVRITNLVCLFLLLSSTTAFSQKSVFRVLNDEKVLGKSLIDSSDIKGKEFIFHDRIHEFFMDATTDLLTVQLRGLSENGKWLDDTGTILQYDTKNEKVLWSKKMAYKMSKLHQEDNLMIYTVGNKSYGLDVNTGDNLWEVKNVICFIDPMNNIGFGYKNKALKGRADELEGIDLYNGNIIWKMKLNREYGWNDVFYLNDSTVMVVAAGLHAINMNTGNGWDYHAVTGAEDYTKAAIASAIGIGVGLLTGTFVIFTGHDIISDLVSNALVDDAFIYFASKEQLVKIDKHSGNIVWEYLFPKDMGSKSSLLLNDSVIYMINTGMGFIGNRQVSIGKPFIAAFERETGKQKYFVFMNTKNDPVLSFQFLNDDVYLVHKNRIVKYNQETGEITEKVFPRKDFGELKHFAGDQTFITNQNGDLLSLTVFDSTNIHIFTNQNKILSLDNQLNVINTIESEEVSTCYLRTKYYKFFAKGEKTLITSNDMEKIAEIDVSSKAFMIDGILYDRRDMSFIAIDLKKIIPFVETDLPRF